MRPPEVATFKSNVEINKAIPPPSQENISFNLAESLVAIIETGGKSSSNSGRFFFLVKIRQEVI